MASSLTGGSGERLLISFRKNLQGLRLQACGYVQGQVTVNAVQFEVVEHAKNPKENPGGYLPEGDEAKARALQLYHYR